MPRRDTSALHQAFDEARFGGDRMLNLRDRLPTAAQAAERAELWLRERQVLGGGEVLLITGRGNASEGGVSVVREAVLRRVASLRRRNVVAEVREHTPGSFVIRLAPMSALLQAPKRRRETMPTPPDPSVLQGLSAETRALLRVLAARALDALGVHAPSRPFVSDEMVRQFGAIAAGVPAGPDREARLAAAIRRAMEEMEEG
ncbi:MAG: hypothetical protein ACJ79S_18125 [Gemmatimonadaceae bacterium]